jgi:hypothetical protein
MRVRNGESTRRRGETCDMEHVVGVLPEARNAALPAILRTLHDTFIDFVVLELRMGILMNAAGERRCWEALALLAQTRVVGAWLAITVVGAILYRSTVKSLWSRDAHWRRWCLGRQRASSGQKRRWARGWCGQNNSDISRAWPLQ